MKRGTASNDANAIPMDIGSVFLQVMCFETGLWFDVLKDIPEVLLLLLRVHPRLTAYWANQKGVWLRLLEHHIRRHTDDEFTHAYPFHMALHAQFFEEDGFNMKCYIAMLNGGPISACSTFLCEPCYRVDAPTSVEYTSIVELYEKLWLETPASYSEEKRTEFVENRDDDIFVPHRLHSAAVQRLFDTMLLFYRFVRSLPCNGCTRRLGYHERDHFNHENEFRVMRSTLDEMILGYTEEEGVFRLHVNSCLLFDRYNQGQCIYADEWIVVSEDVLMMYQDLKRNIEWCVKSAPSSWAECLVESPPSVAPHRRDLYDPIHGLFNTEAKQKRLLLSELNKA